jgi:hypothetical protein
MNPADKAEVYQQLGLSLSYDPAARRVKAEARPEAIMYVGKCPRGDLSAHAPFGAPAPQANAEAIWAVPQPENLCRAVRASSPMVLCTVMPGKVGR